MLSKNEILARLQSNKDEILSYGIERIALFGSYATNVNKPDSDIDILVHFQKGMESFDNFINLCFYLDSLFPGYKVEVVTSEGLNPYIGPYIKLQVEYV